MNPAPLAIQVDDTEVRYDAVRFGKPGAPPVLVLHPAPGATPETIRFAKTVADWGYYVFLPNLYTGSDLGFGINDFPKAKKHYRKSDLWKTRSKSETGEIARHIRAIAEKIHKSAGRKPVVIGNCLTGILPLAIIDSPSVEHGILCQPATPEASAMEILFRWHFPSKAASLGISDACFDRAVAAMKRNPRKQLLGYHYSNDPLAAMQRFDSLQKRLAEHGLGQRFTTFILHPEKTSPADWWTAHGVTAERKKLIKPHSTLVAAAPCDRKRFRKHLRRYLARVSR